MPTKKKTEKESVIEPVKYQWIKGDNQGTVETVSDTNDKFVMFKSGSRISHSVIKEFMLKIDMDNPVLQFDDPLTKPIQPKPGEVAAKAVEVAKNMESLRAAVNQSRQPLPSSPILPILEKAKTKKTKLNVRISMDLPSKEFIDVLQKSWDDDILTIQAEYIVSKIEDPEQFLIDKIKVALSEWFHTAPKRPTRSK